MKTFIIALLIVCSVVIAGSIISLDWQKKSPTPKSTTEAPATAEQSPVETGSIPPPRPTQPMVEPKTNAPAEVTVSTAATPQTAANSVSPIHKLVQTLLSVKSESEKKAAFEELVKNGQLDAAIADLKQMAAANPNDAKIPTTIGEALLYETQELSKDPSHNYDQMGILAMQADQEFNTALQIDPKNWESQFVKASIMYYWPASAQVNNQILQNLTSLIDQQETMSPNSAFAQTYLLLGNEYQKLGQQDKATATWQLGAQEYPNDPTLQKKLAGGAGQ
jgi:hypothetical protein